MFTSYGTGRVDHWRLLSYSISSWRDMFTKQSRKLVSWCQSFYVRLFQDEGSQILILILLSMQSWLLSPNISQLWNFVRYALVCIPFYEKKILSIHFLNSQVGFCLPCIRIGHFNIHKCLCRMKDLFKRMNAVKKWKLPQNRFMCSSSSEPLCKRIWQFQE